MALFKICRGNESNLPVTLTDGYAYFCTDTGNFYIDWSDGEGNVSREHVSAEYATKLRYKGEDGEWVEITAEDIANLSFEQVQADVAEVNPNVPSFIKNKVVGYKPDLLPETVLTFKNDSYMTHPVGPEVSGIRGEGVDFIVTWDGVDYPCTSTRYEWRLIISGEASPMTYLSVGNPALLKYVHTQTTLVSEPNDLPFLIGANMSFAETAGGHSVRIRYADPILKLDKQFLPDGLATEEFVTDAIEQAFFESQQADWTQDDETAADYIKNKPTFAQVATSGDYEDLDGRPDLSEVATSGLYDDLIEKPVLSRVATSGSYNDLIDRLFGDLLDPLEESTLTFSQMEDFTNTYVAGCNSNGILVGESYVVKWGEAEFTCVCKEIDNVDGVFLGNTAKIYIPQGEDSGEPFVILCNGQNISIMTDQTDATRMVGITAVNKVQKLDVKYLPDEAATKSFVREEISKIGVTGDGAGLPPVTSEDNGKVLGVVDGVWNKIDVSKFIDIVDIDILPEQDLTLERKRNNTTIFETSYYAPDQIYTDLRQLKVGETYTVVLDGVEHTCIAKDNRDGYEGTIYAVKLGNESLSLDNREDTGEPFYIAVADVSSGDNSIQGTSVCVVSDTESDSVTVRIRVYQTVRSHVQADWNETDPTSPAFIKNKPDLSNIGNVVTETDILPETTYEGDSFVANEEFGVYQYDVNPSPFTLNIGEEYVVVWDGEAWICEGQDFSYLMEGAVALGDVSKADGVGNGEPFAIGWTPYGVSIFAATKEDHTVRIYQKSVSDSTYSWNDLTDKPFGERVASLTIDSDAVNIDVTFEGLGFTWAKLSEDTLTYDEFVGATIEIQENGGKTELVVSESDVMVANENGTAALIMGQIPIVMCYSPCELFVELPAFGMSGTVSCPEAGTYSLLDMIQSVAEGTIVRIYKTVTEKLGNKYLEIIETIPVPGACVLPEQRIEMTAASNGVYEFESDSPPSLQFNTPYIVVWDGDEYVCKGIEVDGILFLGDLNIVANYTNVGAEPFAIAALEGYVFEVCTLEPDTSHTLAIYLADERQAVKEEYLPILEATGSEVTTTAKITPEMMSTADKVVIAEVGMIFYKISDAAIPTESIFSSEVQLTQRGQSFMIHPSEEDVVIQTDEFMIVESEDDSGMLSSVFAVAYKAGTFTASIGDITATAEIPSVGLYVIGAEDTTLMVEFSCLVTYFDPSVGGYKIKSEYLPSGIGGSGGSGGLPEVSTADAGKFLRVSVDGTWVAETIPNAEEASF